MIEKDRKRKADSRETHMKVRTSGHQKCEPVLTQYNGKCKERKRSIFRSQQNAHCELGKYERPRESTGVRLCRVTE